MWQRAKLIAGEFLRCGSGAHGSATTPRDFSGHTAPVLPHVAISPAAPLPMLPHLAFSPVEPSPVLPDLVIILVVPLSRCCTSRTLRLHRLPHCHTSRFLRHPSLRASTPRDYSGSPTLALPHLAFLPAPTPRTAHLMLTISSLKCAFRDSMQAAQRMGLRRTARYKAFHLLEFQGRVIRATSAATEYVVWCNIASVRLSAWISL